AVKLRRVRGDSVSDDRGLEALVEGAPRCVFDADLRDRAGDQHGVDTVGNEQVGQPGAMEPVVAVLVDLSLPMQRRELIDHPRAVTLTIDVAVCAHEAWPAAAHGRRDDWRPLP